MILRELICTIFLYTFANSELYSPMGTEDSLRQNIEDLMEGKLTFFDESLPVNSNELPDSTPKNNSEYDFIIIGAGTAGSTIASRLSEIPSATVLIIEAGGKEYSIIDIPAMTIPLQFNDEIKWDYQTESSDEYCLGMEDHKCKWPRGKVTGGSSAINYLLATRGNRRDYDNWANITQDNSWSYEHMLPYFKKLENFHANDSLIDSKFHNDNGPLHVSSSGLHTKITDAFLQAGKELGYSEVDYNGPEQIGFSNYQTVIYEGERWSNNRAYLRPAKGRRNLILTHYSHVHKILIDKSTKCAYGVRYSKKGKMYEVKAKKEVILSAGAINSPQILMLSGVGPSDHLRGLDIDVIKDASVGKNLMDHIGYGGLNFKVNDSSDSNDMSLIDSKNPAIKDYLRFRTGPLATVLNIGAVSFMNVDNSNDLRPNIEIIFNPNNGLKIPQFATAYGISEDYQKDLFDDKVKSNSYFLFPFVMRPRSRGTILLSSNNPFDKPKIYPNYLEDPEDVRVMIKGIRSAIELSKTTAFQKHGFEMYEVPLPCNNQEKDSDEYWECAARTYTMTVFHASGTCKMGRNDDASSVVDPQLKVIDIKGLRVADSSIMPEIISGHTNIPVTAIAEKASDMIKKDHGFVK